MAYNARYKIEFVALDGNHFRIEILSDGVSGEVIPLRGAVSPIETTEDSSENLFLPIRKQTGKLMIADTGKDEEGEDFDYTILIPNYILEYQVRLWQIAANNSETLRWIGYIKPDSLTSRLFDKVSIREFQLVCPLGALEEMPVSFSNNKNNLGTVKTMGQILHTALSSVNVEWANVYKQHNTQYSEDLTAKVSLMNFLSENNPTHSTPSDVDTFTATWAEDGTTWGSVVQEICRFWGWTLYSRGLDIIIITHNQYPKFLCFTFAQITGESLSGYADIYDVDVDLESNVTYASANHTECRMLGYRNISVHSSVNEKEMVVDPDFQKLDMSYLLDGVHGIVHWSNDYYYVLRRLTQPSGSESNVIQDWVDNYQVYESRNMPNMINAEFIVYYSDGWSNEDFPTKSEFNLSRGIACYADGTAESVVRPTFFIKTLEDICLPKGSMICIQANAVLSYNPDPDYPTGGTTYNPMDLTPKSEGNTTGPYEAELIEGTNPRKYNLKPLLGGKTVRVSLSIGDKYWSQTDNAWIDNPVKFDLTVREDGSIVSPLNTGSGTGILFNDHYGSKGFCIPNNNVAASDAPICGRLKLVVYNNLLPELPADRFFNCMLTSLAVGIYNTDSKLYPQAKSNHTYKTVTTTGDDYHNFRRDLDVNLSMAAGDKNKYGLGQLYKPDISLLTSVPFRTGDNTYSSKLPEKHLLDIMANAYRAVTPQYTIELRDNAQACLPYAQFLNHWADRMGVYHLLYVSHKWRDGTMRLTLIDK